MNDDLKRAAPDRYLLLKGFARNNRLNPTFAEMILWQHIRGGVLGTKFYRQYIIADYIVDFVSLQYQLVIEVDVAYLSELAQIEYEEGRTQRLQDLGFNVLRFNNDEVQNQIEYVVQTIKNYLLNHSAHITDTRTSRQPLPSLTGGVGGGSSLRAFLFDMDGVLFDSMPGHAYAWAKVMTAYGLPMKEVDAFENEGRTGIGTISIFTQRYWGRDATEEEARDLYERKTVIFNEYMASRGGEAPEIPGAREVLDLVREHGLKRVLVTGSAQQSLLTRLEKHYPGHFTPDLMVTGDDVRYGKPNPEPYLMALKKAGIKADEAVVVENAPLGVRAAVAAGIFTIAVNTGPLDAQLLLDEGANLLFPSMQALADYLKATNFSNLTKEHLSHNK